MSSSKEQVLIVQTAALFENPATRTTGELARNRKGRPVGPLTKSACQWCLIGALSRAAGEDPPKTQMEQTDHSRVHHAQLVGPASPKKTIMQIVDDGDIDEALHLMRLAWSHLKE